MSTTTIHYYEEQQCSVQWRSFLGAFSAEFASKGEEKDLRAFMHQLGRTMSKGYDVTDGSSLQALEACMNRVWSAMNWGWVELVEEADALVVAHHAAPLKVAFGPDALNWSPALLEGVYAQWFEGLGMDKSLRLTQRDGAYEEGQLFVFDLKKQLDEPSYFTRR
ncbi:cellulose biosynthesis protein BcsD [Undibacterium sp. TS12]|uniref:cellulose biosynthesis protein BcsD n=1 Tax=Undibacterium sp. TS12 TaxID=2908202 RepID=UPI001F4CC149|nr:cellulose biosynthesis protein BcsD [Undibacterium sp. TS12]MCH8622858.1 cellulose synthase [Undibacterium sp. TS12]